MSRCFTFSAKAGQVNVSSIRQPSWTAAFRYLHRSYGVLERLAYSISQGYGFASDNRNILASSPRISRLMGKFSTERSRCSNLIWCAFLAQPWVAVRSENALKRDTVVGEKSRRRGTYPARVRGVGRIARRTRIWIDFKSLVPFCRCGATWRGARPGILALCFYRS